MSKPSLSDKSAVLNSMNVDLYERFRQAIAIGKWPNGDLLTEQQRKTCIEAVIVYEHAHIAEDKRTGYIPPKKSACETLEIDRTHEPQKIAWREQNKGE